MKRVVDFDGGSETQTLALTPNKGDNEYGLMFDFKLTYTRNYDAVPIRNFSSDYTFDTFRSDIIDEPALYTLAQYINNLVCEATGIDEDKLTELTEGENYEYRD